MSDLVYTEHAKERMARRGIAEDWVERTVSDPVRIEADPVDEALEHRLAVIPEFDNRVLRVILSKETPHRVITAYFDRKWKGNV